MPRLKFFLLFLLAALMCGLVLMHVNGINGPWYWFWAWRRLSAGSYLFMSLAALPFFTGILLDHWNRRLRPLAILMLMIGSFALRLASAYGSTTPPTLDVITARVEDRFVTSYYTDAQALSSFPTRDWLSLYPQYMQDLSLHSKTKAPGPILYWIFLIHLWGVSHATALRGGLLLGVMATFSIPMTYLMLKTLTSEASENHDRAAFDGAAFLALCPGFVLFFPMFDPVYPILSALLIASWATAVRTLRLRDALILGASLAVTCIVSFNVLIIGLFMAALPFVMLKSVKIASLGRQAAISLVFAALLLFILLAATGYNPIATFLAAIHNQHVLEAQYAGDRHWPITIPFDLTDFALGAGWISVLLAGFWLVKRSDSRPLALLAIGQILLVAVLGLMPTETARVWNFMLPLLMIPVGLELSRWPLQIRLACFSALLLVLEVIHQNMSFMG